MRTFTTVIVLTSLAALTGCSSWLKQHPDTYIKQPTVCIDQKWYGYHKAGGCPSTVKAVVPDASEEMAARLAALESDRQRLADELDAARRQNDHLSSRVGDLERQLADRDSQLSDARADRDQIAANLAAVQNNTGEADALAKLAAANQHIEDHDRLAAESEAQLATARQRIADLEGQLGESKGSLAQAERDFLKALRPEISKGTVSVNQTGDALTINLASSLLFDSGQEQLKAEGTDALRRVGAVLKEFPEKQVHVAGYTDNIAIKGALKKKFPSNKELSDARAESAAQALRDGGAAGNLSAEGHGEANPVATNNTAEGRAKNRRVEVIVQ